MIRSSAVGSRFLAHVAGRTPEAGRTTVIPVVEGMAHSSGERRFVLEPDDPLSTGFVLR